MATSLFDGARILTKRVFGPKKARSRKRQVPRIRLTLEALEDRKLLSATGSEPILPSAVAPSGSYAVQAALSSITSYEYSIEVLQQMVVNLDQQTLMTISRVESTLEQTIEQFIQQALFPNSTESNQNKQSASMGSGQTAGQNFIGQTPSDQPEATSGALLANADGMSPAGGPGQPAGFSPQQISQAYGFNQITFDNGTVTGNGSGQTIAIVDAYNQPNITSDLSKFDSEYGLAAPPSFNVVNESGGSTLPSLPPSGTNWGVEISMDVEWAHAMAPGANILLVEANSNKYSDLLTAVTYASNQPGVSVVSMSWGGIESDLGSSLISSYDSDFTTPSGHNGVTFVASTGDDGSAGAPEYPSVSPNVLAVGGTQLTTDSEGDYESETGWSGSGGGISAYESQPSYQNGVVTQSSTMRTVPDVAYNASGGSPYAVYDSSGYDGWIEAYGTSAAAPQWAALVAIADQGRALNGDDTLDGPSQTLPALYQMPSSNFHDITTGSNGSYSAGSGYDLVTGLGTPIANLVVNSLVSYDASYWQNVDLSSYYNRDGLTWGGTPITGGGIDGNNDALEGFASVNWQGNSIPLGPVNALDVVSAQGQTITLPAGQYSTLTIFATAVNSGNQTNQNFTVNYSDYTQQTFTRSLTNWLTYPEYSDEVRLMQTDAFNPDGSEMSSPAYVSAYALALDPAKTVQSITLPNDGNIVILGMALYHDSAAAQPATLSSDYNRNGLTWGGTPITGGGIDGNNDALEGFASVNWQGNSVPLGPVNALDVVSAKGQTITLPAGQYSTLTIFATAVNSGNQTNQNFTVNYSDYTQQTFTRSLTNWLTYPEYSDELRLMQTDAFNPDGSEMSGPAYVSAYALPLDPTKTVQSITLPNDSNIVILAIEVT